LRLKRLEADLRHRQIFCVDGEPPTQNYILLAQQALALLAL
jgi:hypothetical protein